MEEKVYRDYRRLVERDEQGKLQIKVFAGDIHYYNKLKLGDGTAGFRRIDNTLEWVELPNRRGWTFQYHSYQPLAPEYADEWILYRDLYHGKDQVFGMKARGAGHVLGRLVQNIPGVTDQNAVIYDDAFGPGIDLIIKFTFRKMVKLVRIREGFYPAADTDFDFALLIPDGSGFYQKDLDTKELLPLDPATPVALRPRSELYIGTDRADGRDWYTRVQPIRIWDSGVVTGPGTGMKMEITPAAIAIIGGKPFLRKRLRASFFTDAVGDVYTDATFNYYEDKDTYYGTSFTTGGNPNGTNLAIGGWGDFYYSFLEFDLTNLPAAADVSDVKLSLKLTGVAANDSTTSIQRVTASWTEAGVTSASNPAATTTNQVALTNPVTVGAGNRDDKSILTFYTGWKNGTFSNFGVKLNSTTNNNAQHNYHSSDASSYTHFPYLLITPVAGLSLYTRGSVASLPTDTTDFATQYSSGDVTDVSSDNATRVTLTGAGPILVHQFKYGHSNNTDAITALVNLQCTNAPSSKIVKLQIYNFNTPGWEDLDTDNATAANTDFDLTGTISTNISNYYDASNYVYIRVYQDIT